MAGSAVMFGSGFSFAASAPNTIWPGTTQTFDWYPRRDGLALLQGGPTQAGYETWAQAHPQDIWMPRWFYVTEPEGGVILDTDQRGFIDPAYGSWNPFSLDNEGNCVIAMDSAANLGVTLLNQFTGLPVSYISGVMVSLHRFNQNGGVFQFEIKFNSAASGFPAAWTAPTISNDEEIPEIDFVEWDYTGGQMRMGAFSYPPRTYHGQFFTENLQDGQFHTYTTVWRNGTITWYKDADLKLVEDVSSFPQYMNQVYLILAPGILGNGPFTMPQNMIVRRVRAAQFN